MLSRLVVAFLLTAVASCTVLRPSRASTEADIAVTERSNGALVEISLPHAVGEVAALVVQGNWVLLTIPDTTVELTPLLSFRSELVDSVEVARFSSAVQLSLHITRPVRTAEVVRGDEAARILVSLFLRED